MKQKRTNFILSCLVLLAAVLAEVYCFLEFPKDALMILGTGAIILVAGYMAIDSLLSLFLDQNTKKKDGDKEEWKHQLEEVLKVQKASFVQSRKLEAKENELLGRIVQQTAKQNETIVKTAKLAVKYNKEDTQKLMIMLRKLSEKPGFDGTEILQALEAHTQSINQNLDKLARSIAGLGSIRVTSADAFPSSENLMPAAEEPVSEQGLEEEPGVIAEAAMAGEPELISAPEEAEPEPIPEPEPAPAPEIDLSDPNKMMSPDDIAALLASMGGEEAAPAEEAEPEPIPEPEPAPAPEIDLSDPNKMMSPDDIAALLASMGGEEAAPAEEAEPEPIPEPEPAPEIDLSDPNKMMSPDDIAALLASMGQ